MNIIARFNTERGAMTLEAVLFLPVFILAVMTLVGFIRMIGVHEKVTHAALDETNRLIAEAYAVKTPVGFAGRIEGRIKDENPKIREVTVSKFGYLYRDLYGSGIISFQLNGKAEMHMPLDFGQTYEMENRFKCRGFIGKQNRTAVLSFDEMEREGNSEIVWIFPMSGKRYHGEACIYVKNNPRQQVLNQRIRRQYEPCKLCKPEGLMNGVFVYCFPKTGEVYHKADCKVIDKYTVEIEREHAVEKGYTPCSKCGGE